MERGDWREEANSRDTIVCEGRIAAKKTTTDKKNSMYKKVVEGKTHEKNLTEMKKVQENVHNVQRFAIHQKSLFPGGTAHFETDIPLLATHCFASSHKQNNISEKSSERTFWFP